jgi:hydroxyacylglutathione hydrolase
MMILKQYYLACLSQASYLLGDESTHTAVIVDPRRDVDIYLEEAKQLGLTISHVLLTHFHADFVSGHVELRERCDAQLYLGAQAKADYTFTPLADGQSLTFGQLRLQILETPGHTPESISIVAYDLSKSSDTPQAVLTGDTLFIGDVGRPDLLGSIGYSAEQMASDLYDSVFDKLLKLPDETALYPGHGAGSMCGKNLSKETVSTIGEQRRFNVSLQAKSKTDFIEIVTTGQSETPQYFALDAVYNRQERNSLDTNLKRLQALNLSEVLKHREQGAQLLDCRDAVSFETGHLKGSTNVGLKGSYATWAGTVLDGKRDIVLIADVGTEREAALRLGRIGYDKVVGYLDGGPKRFSELSEPLIQIARVTATELAEKLISKQPPLILDVRTDSEVADSQIHEGLHIPLNQLHARLAEVPMDQDLVVHCRSGYRSAIAASLLAQQGATRIADLVGGILAWQEHQPSPDYS